MSLLTVHSLNDEQILEHCMKKCGFISASDDLNYFALGCLFCSEKFIYFDAFIGHMQTIHSDGVLGTWFGAAETEIGGCSDENDYTDTDPSLLEPQMVIVKEEMLDEEDLQETDRLAICPPYMDDECDNFPHIKQEQSDTETSNELDRRNANGTYDYGTDFLEDGFCEEDDSNSREDNYDDLVEESLLSDTNLTMHIKDRKMIKFLIESYRRNPFLWDHRHVQFRDRVKRQKFLDWIISEFKRRFNLSLAKEAVTRKWDNLRTVYKRECNRMAQEQTNISTLWYFKELHFLNTLYDFKHKLSEAIVKETVYRRRYSALWNDVSTCRLLEMVKQCPCFYDKNNVDYRSKEKRGEALQMMSLQLQDMVDVTTIQISKRISQLRFDYSKQKQERLQTEQSNKVFVPNYSYYDQMKFMDADVAPFQCDYCSIILQTPREMDLHLLTHQPNSDYTCPVCNIAFFDFEQLNDHKQVHMPLLKEVKYHCDLCRASFRERSNYDEHMRRHNDELLLPSLANSVNVKVDNLFHKRYTCDVCNKSFATISYLNSHKALHTNQCNFTCVFPHCGKKFAGRQSMMEHVKLHYNEEEYKCDICGKTFKSGKNLQNHKQIHDAIKRYVCKICGSAFAQAAGLYLHKRRHNRSSGRTRQSC